MNQPTEPEDANNELDPNAREDGIDRSTFSRAVRALRAAQDRAQRERDGQATQPDDTSSATSAQAPNRVDGLVRPKLIEYLEHQSNVSFVACVGADWQCYFGPTALVALDLLTLLEEGDMLSSLHLRFFSLRRELHFTGREVCDQLVGTCFEIPAISSVTDPQQTRQEIQALVCHLQDRPDFPFAVVSLVDGEVYPRFDYGGVSRDTAFVGIGAAFGEQFAQLWACMYAPGDDRHLLSSLNAPCV
jgi:hypothetical protein